MIARPLRALIVDDEQLAREGLRDDVTALGVEVVGSCADAHTALGVIRREKPDVLFLDIEMPEANGFALLEQLEPEDVPPAVIFVTAYDQHAVAAFEARALDYLLKPVATDRLRGAIERAEMRIRERHALSRVLEQASLDSEPVYLRTIVVRDGEVRTVIPVDTVEWIEAETYYVRLHVRSTRSRLLRERMSVLEQRLDPAKFFRTHRSAIVRVELIREIRATSRYEHTIVLATGAIVPLSRDRRAELERRVQT